MSGVPSSIQENVLKVVIFRNILISSCRFVWEIMAFNKKLSFRYDYRSMVCTVTKCKQKSFSPPLLSQIFRGNSGKSHNLCKILISVSESLTRESFLSIVALVVRTSSWKVVTCVLKIDHSTSDRGDQHIVRIF